MKNIRIINFDAQDAVGKTTQLNLLHKKLIESKTNVYSTRLLGGDGTCSFQLAMRTALLHSKFPKDSVELEELMFNLTDAEGIKEMENFLIKNPKSLALKDRSLFSHIAYSVAKGLSMDKTLQLHENLVHKEKVLNHQFGSVNILFRPDSNEWVKQRLLSRNKNQDVEIVDRLENDTTQEKVWEMVNYLPNHVSMQGINFEIIPLFEKDSIS